MPDQIIICGEDALAIRISTELSDADLAAPSVPEALLGRTACTATAGFRPQTPPSWWAWPRTV